MLSGYSSLPTAKNTPDRKCCCLRETVCIETDQWTVLQKQLRKKKNNFERSGVSGSTARPNCSLRMKDLMSCTELTWSSCNSMESVIQKRYICPPVLLHCSSVLFFASWEVCTVCTLHWTTDSFLRLQCCLTHRATWEHRDDIKTGNGQLFTDMAFGEEIIWFGNCREKIEHCEWFAPSEHNVTVGYSL